MSGFGGGGGGGRNSGGRGRGRGRGRRNNYQGNNYNPNHRSGGNNSTNHPQARLLPCKGWTTTGSCRNNNCNFAHVVKLHAKIDASSLVPNDNNNSHNQGGYNKNNQTFAPVSSVAIWETQGAIKIFTGSKDGFWRLWNTQGGTFNKEFEHNMGGPVECLVVESNFLFCGFDSISPSLPEVNVGMIHAWNLENPTAPPLEFRMHDLIPYAHAQAVSTLLVVDGQKIVSGSKDGSIRLWTYDNANPGFVLAQTLHGHAREVTGLAIANDTVLWSSSIDGSIRIWDLSNNGVCQYAITMATGGDQPNSQSPGPGQQPQQPPSGGGIGHTNAVTCLLSFQSPSGTFVLSSSLDGWIKAWNGANGQLVASETHGEGVVTMSMATDASNNQLLLIGLESGNIMVRNIIQTAKMPAFTLLMTLSSHYTAGHNGAVKALCKGPAGTFYSGGNDGKVLVLQFDGDLGL